MSKVTKFLLLNLYFTIPAYLQADFNAGTNAQSLDQAIKAANATPNGTVSINNNISLSGQVRPLNANKNFTWAGQNINIVGTNNLVNFTIEGENRTRGFFIGSSNTPSPNPTTVTIKKIRFLNTVAQGGNGTDGGGGGMGAGGALFVGKNAVVVVENCEFENCQANGGAASQAKFNTFTPDNFFGGGGGMRGNGGPGFRSIFNGTKGGGGGGFGGNGSGSLQQPGAGGGANGLGLGDAQLQTPGGNFDGERQPTGTGGIGGAPMQSGGFGGGGGGATDAFHIAADGNFGGGGGGGRGLTGAGGGAGGFGGGGGAINSQGGYGGGGGLGSKSIGGNLAGSGNANTSGKGAGLGGAIFIQDGGLLILKGSNVFTNNRASGNSVSNSSFLSSPKGQLPADTRGNDIFMMSGSTLRFDVGPNIVVNIPNPIHGDGGLGGGNINVGGVEKIGQGKVIIAGTTFNFPVSSQSFAAMSSQSTAAAISSQFLNALASSQAFDGLSDLGEVETDLSLETIQELSDVQFSGSTYTGGTRIFEGDFGIVDTTVIGDCTVMSGARLFGNCGILDGGNLNIFGMVSPGIPDEDTLGTIAVDGQITLNGIYQATIQPSATVNNDTLITNESTNLGASSQLVLDLLRGNYIAGTTFTVIDGPTVGTFATVSQTGPLAGLLDFQINYGSVTATVLNNRIFQDQKITAAPAKEVVKCILAAIPITPNSDFAKMIQELGTLSDKSVNQALTEISPVELGALEWINARNNSYIASLIAQAQFKLRCPSSSCDTADYDVWINGFGNFMNNHHRLDHLKPYEADAGGVVTGMDYRLGSHFFLGGSFGYVGTNLDWQQGGGGNLNSFLGALYSIYESDHLNADLSLLGGGTDYDIRRKLKFGSVNRNAKSDFWGEFFTAHLGMCGKWNHNRLQWGPFGLLDYHFFHRNGFHEHGAQSLDLHVKSKNQNMLRAEAGLKGHVTIQRHKSCIAPYFGISYVGEFPLHKSRQRASFTGQSCVIDVVSYHSSVNLGSGELGFKWIHDNGFSFIVGYKGLFNTKTSINEAEGRLEWNF